MEYMTKGSLLDTLRDHHEEFKFSDILDFIIGACCGMVFLESKKILHRDLACRNILVTKIDDKYRVKVSDFGLAKGLDEERAYYKSGDSKPIPVRWTAPEVLNLRRYTTAADIWSFGVTAWEILDFGKIPYNWLNNKEVSIEVPRGERLPRPDFCPEELWQIIFKCFAKDPKDRPTFRSLLSELSAYRGALPSDEASAVSKVAMEDRALYQPSDNFVPLSTTAEDSAQVDINLPNSTLTSTEEIKEMHYNRDEELGQAPQVKDFGYLK